MKKHRIYLDTSVYGGYFDSEFEVETKLLFDKIKIGEYYLILSDLTERELLSAPERVRFLFNTLELTNYEMVLLNAESITLADQYLNENVVGETSREDYLHIALATVNQVDVLVSWNFKHMVNIKRIRGYNSVNIKNGYKPIEIRSPLEMIDYDE